MAGALLYTKSNFQALGDAPIVQGEGGDVDTSRDYE